MPVPSPVLIAAIVFLVVSFVWAIITREISALLFAVWAADILYIFGSWFPK